MDKATLKELGAEVTGGSVRYSAKAWGDGQSVGGDWEVQFTIGPDAEPEETAKSVWFWLKALAHDVMSAEMTEALETASPAAPPPAAPPAAPPLTGETEVLETPFLVNVATASGQNILKVFGGKYSKYGVPMWPEVVSDYPELAAYATWQAVVIGKEGLPSNATKYGLPAGYTKAVVQIEGGQPKRVLKLA